MKSWMLSQEVFNNGTPMNSTSIPQEHHRPSQVIKEDAKEFNNFHARDVLVVKAEIETDPLACRGNRDGRDCGNTIPPVVVPQKWRDAYRRPRPTDVGNEQKPAFVEKYEMGAKSLGFFLHATNCISSNVRWLSHPFPKPVVPASDNSSQNPPSTSIHGWDDISRRNAFRSVRQCASMSISLFDSQPLKVPAPTTAAAFVSATSTIEVVDQALAWAEVPLAHSCENSGTSALQNSRMSSPLLLRTSMSCPLSIMQWPCVFAFPTVEVFLGVSCPIV